MKLMVVLCYCLTHLHSCLQKKNHHSLSIKKYKNSHHHHMHFFCHTVDDDNPFTFMWCHKMPLRTTLVSTLSFQCFTMKIRAMIESKNMAVNELTIKLSSTWKKGELFGGDVCPSLVVLSSNFGHFCIERLVLFLSHFAFPTTRDEIIWMRSYILKWRYTNLPNFFISLEADILISFF